MFSSSLVKSSPPFGEVEPALQRLVHHAAVVAAGQAELRLHRRTQQRAAELVEPLALHDNAGRRPVEGLHVGDREAHVLQAQRLERLEPEDVADDRGGQVRDRARLEQVEVVGDIGEPRPRRAGDGVDPVALGAVAVGRRQPIRPDHRPGGGRAFAGDRRRGFLRIHAVLRRDPEAGEDVRLLRLVVQVEVAHLLVLHHAGVVAAAGWAGDVHPRISLDGVRRRARHPR